MTAATHVQPVAVPSLHKVKMEERKRSLAPDADDHAPSRKRQLKDENGQAMRMDPEKEKDVEVRDACYTPAMRPWLFGPKLT